ncbi:putative PEP-binding protein [Haloglomus halophilum]|uniref:putative PEP-binding protein n=1 Tax=Haloglomus halophilum TaxID=2962672 RepID=UPI0020C97CA8|nr:putative PEP-binding protein [Haloglomus halophilum]
MNRNLTPIQSGLSLGPAKRLSGRLVCINDHQDLGDISEGDIAYIGRRANKTNNVVLFYDIIRSGAQALLCENIGRTDHGIVLAKELNIPCLSDISRSIEQFEGEILTLRTDEVYLGKRFVDESFQPVHSNLSYPETDTTVAINLGFPEVIARRQALPDITDGVGFMRLEFVLLDILDNTHPKAYIRRHGREQLVAELATRIEPVLEAYESSVWIRTDDFSVRQLRKMDGGSQYEQPEENPMLGWRGVSRSIAEPTLYDVQLDAIRRLSDRGHQNIGLFPPMTRFPGEYDDWKSRAIEAGLDAISFGVMVETPAAALTFEAFVDDISFVVFGSNDLTQFTLAIDRNNNRLQSKYDETSAALLSLFERVISIANEYDIKSCIAGQAAANESLVADLLSFGIDILSVNPDYKTVADTRQFTAQLEGD